MAVLASDHGFEKHPFTLGSHFGGDLSGPVQAGRYKEAPAGGVMWMGVAPPDRTGDARTFVESAQDEAP